MKSIIIALSLLIAEGGSAQTADSIMPVIPKPVSIHRNEGVFSLSSATLIITSNRELRSEAELFNDFLQKRYGFRLRFSVTKHRPAGAITLSIGTNVRKSAEGYTMSVKPSAITISGGRAGVFYGLQTLMQLLPIGKHDTIDVPCMDIDDAPRYAWRGMHLDVGRHFFPTDFIKKYIDFIAMYKMNTFHWHLTEDQGWRLEIKKYPKLTQIGAWRNGSMVGAYAEQKFDTARYGGFYTQREIKEIVAYAQQRHVTIVPEIEMPGHSTAALAAYPELSCTGGPFEVGKAWGVYDDVYCTRKETFKFLQDVLTEVCALFPGKYIHIGGDECPKERWKKCERCQALIKKEKLKGESELQSYFIRRIEKFLNSKGKQIIGWDEILEGGLAPKAAVMSWRGTDGGIAAAKQKHRAVMTPGSHCYFDHYQGTPQYEPLAIGGYTTVEKVYSYEPTPAELSAGERQYILGAQGNVWTEYINTPRQVEYMAIPRMAALAEVVWSPAEQRDYGDFRQRLLQHFQLLDKMGVNYSKAIYEIKAVVKPSIAGNGIVFELSSPFDSTGIKYTIDGSEPASTSPQYRSAIDIPSTLVVKAAYFDMGKQRGNTLIQSFIVSKSTGKSITLKSPPHENYFGSGAFTLVDGVRGDFARHGQNWLGWWGPDMEATVDLGKPEQITKVTIDVFDGEGSWIHLPKSVEVFVSNDTVNFGSVKKLSAEEIRKGGNILEMNIGDRTARYVKVVAENAGKIPEGKPGATNDAWLFVDEIMIE